MIHECKAQVVKADSLRSNRFLPKRARSERARLGEQNMGRRRGGHPPPISHRYLTSERSERVRCRFCHSNIKFISLSHRVISSIYLISQSKLRNFNITLLVINKVIYPLF